MSLLLKKEIRLLLPSTAAALALVIVLPWFWRSPYSLFSMTTVALFFGLLVLATTSFGREITMGTFSSLLVQPVERRRIWWTKIGLLLAAAALVFGAYCISCLLRINDLWLNPLASHGLLYLKNNFAMAAGIGGVFVMMALSGGLWTTLLFRNTMAAFWVAFLIPAGTLMLELLLDARLVKMVALLMVQPGEEADGHLARVLIYKALLVLGVIYGVAGILYSKRLFQRAQDADSAGKSFALFSGSAATDAKNAARAIRRPGPVLALLKKEFHLHSVSLLFAGVLLFMHVCAILLRSDIKLLDGFPVLQGFVQYFWAFWLVIPLIVGAMALAEERKLGVTESQFCLPVPPGTQFLVKFLPAMLFAIVLGGVIPMALEIAASAAGSPGVFFKMSRSAGGHATRDIMALVAGDFATAAGLALIGLWASTLARNFLQALSFGFVGVVMFLAVSAIITSKRLLAVFGVSLPMLSVPVFTVALVWLAWRNYKYFAEHERILRRNALALIIATLVMFAGSAAIYYRAWEVFQPAEPAHGKAVLSLENPPRLQGDHQGNLLVGLPDGRIWTTTLHEVYSRDYRKWKRKLFRSLPGIRNSRMLPADLARNSNAQNNPKDFGQAQLAAETGAVDVALTHGRGAVALNADGSLWRWRRDRNDLEKTDGSKPVRVGIHNDWVGIVEVQGRAITLAADGSLWMWPNVYDRSMLTKHPPKQPKRLANIFDAAP